MGVSDEVLRNGVEIGPRFLILVCDFFVGIVVYGSKKIQLGKLLALESKTRVLLAVASQAYEVNLSTTMNNGCYALL